MQDQINRIDILRATEDYDGQKNLLSKLYKKPTKDPSYICV